MNRRSFLKALAGGAVMMSAGGIALLEAEPIVKTYFLPPRCGWNAGSWELALAQEALRIVTDKLCVGAPLLISNPGDPPVHFSVVHAFEQQYIDSLLARRARLVERCDKLARGWTPHRQVYDLPEGRRLVIHGGRSDGRRAGELYIG